MIRPLCIQDLQFANTVVECESASGVRFQRLVRTGMPKITPNAIRCVFYLFRSEQDAIDGVDPQGTGFLVCDASSIPTIGYWYSHAYAVTNWHVAVDDADGPAAPVIRINCTDGRPHVLPLKPSDWRWVPDLDIAVTPIEVWSNLDLLGIPTGMFLSPARVCGLELGVGEDVFMMGLFVNHHGGATNVPAARFGNISMMPNPNALVPQGRLADTEAFVIDMHSRDGFSGSPIFVYRTFGSDLTVPISSHFNVELGWQRTGRGMREVGTLRSLSDVRLNVEHQTIFDLLGIHYAQFPEEFESEKAGTITGLSGMTCALPSWRILDVLNLPEFVEMRKERDREAEKAAKKRPKPEKKAKAADAVPEGDRDAFKRLLGEAVKRPRSSG